MTDIIKVQEIAKKLRKLSTEYSRLSWVQYTTGYDMGVDEANNRFMDILKDKQNYKTILDHLEKDPDPVDRRRVKLLEKRFRNYHLSPELNELSKKIQKKSTELSKVLNTHRNKLDGREISSVELGRIISESDDQDLRRKAFLARTSVNKPLVDAGFIELLDMRKDFAAKYGAENYVSYSLEQDELDSSIFSTWKDELLAALPKTRQLGREFALKFLQKEEIMPWDSAYVSGKIAPELNKEINMTGFFEPVAKLFAKFGFDLSQENITYDVFPRKNKSEWGYNFPIETGKDSRILANVQNRYNQFKVLLHETGHGIHNARLNPDDPMLNMGVSGIISEGIANLFGSFVCEEIFYGEFFKNDIETARGHFLELKKWQNLSSLTAIENILFDQKLYLTSIKTIDDIHQLKWDNYKELLGKEPYSEEPAWGFLIHHTTHPIYLHNYFMGDVTCEMLKKVFCKDKKVDSITEKPFEFGKFLLENVIKPAGRYPYAELFKRISGEDFSLKFVREDL